MQAPLEIPSFIFYEYYFYTENFHIFIFNFTVLQSSNTSFPTTSWIFSYVPSYSKDKRLKIKIICFPFLNDSFLLFLPALFLFVFFLNNTCYFNSSQSSKLKNNDSPTSTSSQFYLRPLLLASSVASFLIFYIHREIFHIAFPNQYPSFQDVINS